MRCILMISQVAVCCSLLLWPSVTTLFRAQYSRSDRSDYVMIINNGRAMCLCQAFFLQSCSDSLYFLTFETVYKLKSYKRKVKVFVASASYGKTPKTINDCNVSHIRLKSLSNLSQEFLRWEYFCCASSCS